MIKLTGKNTDTGMPFLALGLSEGNLGRLREGKPIHILAAEMPGIGVDIIIFWGETEDKLAEQVRLLLDEDTRFTDRRREKKQ